MSDKKQTSPPRWANRLLEWYCRPELLEDLQGDLHEYFHRHCQSKGSFRAKLIYVGDVFKFFRSYTVRRPDFINFLIHWIMLNSYLKTSGRVIVRNKLFSTINIIGLALSMSVGLIVIGMLRDGFSYDRFHDNHERIYRLISRYEYNGKKDADFHATTSLNASQRVKESFAEVEGVAILHRGFSGDVEAGEKKIPLEGFWSNEDLFSVFSFPLLQGNSATALKSPFSVVLTEESALKLFNHENVLGKTIRLHDRDYTITGVMKDIPRFSHVKFDMLASINSREITEKENPRENAWDNIWRTWTYILLPPGTDLQTFQTKLDRLSAEQDKTVEKTHIELGLQPLGEIITGDNLSNPIGPTLGKTTVWILTSLTIIVILCAALNYTNLSIARAFSRSKEVGIRKTIGADRSHVTFQFITESVLISLAALVIAFGLFILVKPHFISLEPTLQQLLVMELSPMLIVFFILFAVAIGIFAGVVPATFFARINAIQVLKSGASTSSSNRLTFRKALIVFQSSISIIAITTTLIFYKQYTHFVSYDLGFTTENILNIPIQGNNAEYLKKNLLELPEVKAVSKSQMITSIGDYWGAKMKYNDPTDSAQINYAVVDAAYIPLHGHQLIAGRNFTIGNPHAAESEVIVNEQVLKRFQIGNGNPAAAIEEVVKVDNKDLRIVGVVKDFQYGRANSPSTREVIFRHSETDAAFLNVKISSDDWVSTYAKIESLWKAMDPVHPFAGKFYDEQIEEAFAGLKASMKVGGFLAMLVISISSIGLLGMVVFTTETRIREISIRKVLGASESGLVLKLSKGFLFILLTSGAIALPVTYLFFNEFLLPKIPNHLPVQLPEMVVGYAMVVVIAIAMIGSQTFKIARTNPAEVLKNE